MNEAVLLDTCTVLWLAEDSELAVPARAAVEAAEASNEIHVSPISAWEIALLVARGRLAINLPIHVWFSRFLAARGSVLAAMPPEVLIDSAFLPGKPPRDPADQILAATARHYGLVLITRDRRLLAYASAGHIKAIAC